jgi:hypothetical protein
VSAFAGGGTDLARTLAIAFLGLLLASCSAFQGREPIRAAPVFTCAELKQYSKAEQNRIADQIEAHGASVPDVVGLIDDYGNLRAGLRKMCT